MADQPEIEVDEAGIDRAMCGWNNVPMGHRFSDYQRHPNTRAAWRRALHAFLCRPMPDGSTPADLLYQRVEALEAENAALRKRVKGLESVIDEAVADLKRGLK